MYSWKRRLRERKGTMVKIENEEGKKFGRGERRQMKKNLHVFTRCSGRSNSYVWDTIKRSGRKKKKKKRRRKEARGTSRVTERAPPSTLCLPCPFEPCGLSNRVKRTVVEESQLLQWVKKVLAHLVTFWWHFYENIWICYCTYKSNINMYSKYKILYPIMSYAIIIRII